VPSRRILVAVYDYPPSTSVGGIRWVTMKKYLERLGHEVTVLTTDAFGSLATDEADRVIRVRDLVSSQRLRTALRRPKLPHPGEEVPVDTTSPALLTSVFVPDIYAVSWAPFAIGAMRHLVHDRGFDALISTSPKDSTHLIGLARPGSLPWIADFRDGWVFESVRPPLPTRIQRAIDRRLESWVVRRADGVVAFSDVLADDFERRLGRHSHCIPSGFDPELVGGDAASKPLLDDTDPGRVRLVYTGTLTGDEGAPTDRSPAPLFEALEYLVCEEAELARRLQVVIIGRRTGRDDAILARFDHLGLIRHLGYVPRDQALAIQRAADVLVGVSSRTPSSVPLKLFEYLGAGRPILLLGYEGAATRIIDETRAGAIVSPDDRRAIVEQLRRIATGQFEREFAPRDVERYAYPGPAERMAELIEEVIAARAR
jgi:glycosyltransferase involved in cell wall biosynthesis